MITTPNMSLTRWDLEADPYDHTQLSANFNVLDLHRHIAGEGRKIPTGGIENDAITAALIATGAVTTAEILDGTITLADLSDALRDLLSPLGTTLWLWMPAAALLDLEATSSGRWVLARGQTILAANHSFATGGASITLPDARNAYALGADFAGTGTGVGTPPAIGAIVGAHTIDLRHTHTVNGHTHTVAGHTHTVISHSHNVSAHHHGIAVDGAHDHEFFDDSLTTNPLNTRGIATPGPGNFQALYKAGLNTGNSGSVPVVMEDQGSHTHGGGITANTATTTDSQSPSTSSTGLTSDSTSPGTSNPSVDQSAVDKRPRSLGLACYVRVKN